MLEPSKKTTKPGVMKRIIKTLIREKFLHIAIALGTLSLASQYIWIGTYLLAEETISTYFKSEKNPSREISIKIENQPTTETINALTEDEKSKLTITGSMKLGIKEAAFRIGVALQISLVLIFTFILKKITRR